MRPDAPAHRKTVGVIGGMGPLAAQEFLRTLVMETDAERDQDHLHVLLDSDPHVPDRTRYLLGSGEDPRPAIRAVARRLWSAGAELLVMPCNTANVFADDVSGEVSIPLVPWFETVVGAVEAVRTKAIGLLATSGTRRVGTYQALFADRGIEVVLPTDEEQLVLMDTIYGAGGVKSTRRVAPANRERLLAVAEALAFRGATALLLACTELPLIAAADDHGWPLPAIDPAVPVARRVIRAAGGEIRGEGPAG